MMKKSFAQGYIPTSQVEEAGLAFTASVIWPNLIGLSSSLRVIIEWAARVNWM